MDKSIPHHAVIVVADGAKAVLFRNTGQHGHLELELLERVTAAGLGGQGPSGSRPPDQTAKQTGEATFVNQLVHTIQAMYGQGVTDPLVLVAAPQTLGELREALPKLVAQHIVQTVSKDYTNLPTSELAERLQFKPE